MDLQNDAENGVKNIQMGQTEDETLMLSKVSENSDINILDPDELKVKVEIELEEEADGLVYEADFHGHLQLVSLTRHVPTVCNSTESSHSGIKKWDYTQQVFPTAEVVPSMIVSGEQNEHNVENVYGQLKNVSCDIPKEIYTKKDYSENLYQNSALISPKVHDFSVDSSWQKQFVDSSWQNQYVDNSWQKQFAVSNQNNEPQQNDQHRAKLFILAEKKRTYRKRIKEENPSMWSAIKQKEACKKREQREERRLILLEMQRAMELISLPDTPEIENHKIYLQALKERYPDLWNQLINAMSAAEIRNKEMMNEKALKNSRRLVKPVTMYKDVVEAQKKYLYRQRLKIERPEMYEKQKARETYAKSVKRMMLKAQALAENREKVNTVENSL